MAFWHQVTFSDGERLILLQLLRTETEKRWVSEVYRDIFRVLLERLEEKP